MFVCDMSINYSIRFRLLVKPQSNFKDYYDQIHPRIYDVYYTSMQLVQANIPFSIALCFIAKYWHKFTFVTRMSRHVLLLHGKRSNRTILKISFWFYVFDRLGQWSCTADIHHSAHPCHHIVTTVTIADYVMRRNLYAGCPSCRNPPHLLQHSIGNDDDCQ